MAKYPPATLKSGSGQDEKLTFCGLLEGPLYGITFLAMYHGTENEVMGTVHVIPWLAMMM